MHLDFWPGEYRGAVSLTFDDGAPSHLDRAIPLLNAHGLRGTFYLCPRGDDFAERLAAWKEPHEAGHEIGNHTMNHFCSRNFNPTPGAPGLETMTLEEMDAELAEAERRLQEVFPREHRSFCYPCYMCHVGEGANRKSYVPLVAQRFIAARGGGEYGFANHPINADLACLAGQACERMTGPELVGFAERAARQGRWAVLAFHSIECGRLGTALHEFRELIEHLGENRDRIWAAPVAEIAEYLVEVRAGMAR